MGRADGRDEQGAESRRELPPRMDYSSLDVLITSSAGQGRSLTRTNATTGLAEEFATKSASHGSSWLWKEADQSGTEHFETICRLQRTQT